MLGQEAPCIVTPPPGPRSREFALRLARAEYPANVARRALREEASGVSQLPITYATAQGSNVVDVDGNRYVDLTAGFGALLLGHNDRGSAEALRRQAGRLWHALGDVYPSDAKIELLEALTALAPFPDARVILGQSGADAVSAALKTALLTTGKPGVVAFEGAYHGLSYGPLAVCGYRNSFREPFRPQLNPHVRFIPFPSGARDASEALDALEGVLRSRNVGAVLVEPILGRGGCIPAPAGFLQAVGELTRRYEALVIVDEIWTGLGRSGSFLLSVEQGLLADLICLGKGLGGGLPLSACLGTPAAMHGWTRGRGDVVHTSTFSGSPLACATALTLLSELRRQDLSRRSAVVGAAWVEKLHTHLRGIPGYVEVRGAGLMVGVELTSAAVAFEVGRKLLTDGYITLGGGRDYEALTLTPPLTIEEHLLDSFTEALVLRLREAVR
ncbi:MAG: aspartate aminotransferase family protein [Myxococcales bacterium]|nr:aspartate aminotransferase family protein [Polyangiaceae bacterium]MDW8250060.1 aspartate aminotransferase family protein [Myxococcales bacterium]